MQVLLHSPLKKEKKKDSLSDPLLFLMVRVKTISVVYTSFAHISYVHFSSMPIILEVCDDVKHPC